MILAAHLIFSAYGFWLPNDPRGSWSDFVRAYELWKFGPATPVTTRRSVANRPHNAALRAAAKRALAYPPVIFNGHQALAIAKGFAEVIQRTECVIHACAILPDHAHLVVARHRYPIQQLANLLKGGATTSLNRHDLSPFRETTFSGGPQGRAPSPWSQRYWKVWLDSTDAVDRSIEYVNQNPLRQHFKTQQWSFVTPFPIDAVPM